MRLKHTISLLFWHTITRLQMPCSKNRFCTATYMVKRPPFWYFWLWGIRKVNDVVIANGMVFMNYFSLNRHFIRTLLRRMTQSHTYITTCYNHLNFSYGNRSTYWTKLWRIAQDTDVILYIKAVSKILTGARFSTINSFFRYQRHSNNGPYILIDLFLTRYKLSK